MAQPEDQERSLRDFLSRRIAHEGREVNFERSGGGVQISVANPRPGELQAMRVDAEVAKRILNDFDIPLPAGDRGALVVDPQLAQENQARRLAEAAAERRQVDAAEQFLQQHYSQPGQSLRVRMHRDEVTLTVPGPAALAQAALPVADGPSFTAPLNIINRALGRMNPPVPPIDPVLGDGMWLHRFPAPPAPARPVGMVALPVNEAEALSSAPLNTPAGAPRGPRTLV